MTSKEIIKEYTHGDITVVWKPKKCIHSEVCVKTLPDVYDPKDRPWIKPENASLMDLKTQIDTCPSGALSYKMKNEVIQNSGETPAGTRVEVVAKGPLLVKGTLEVTLPDGRTEIKKRSTAFCRCGASANKPYCDGSHNDRDFEG